MGYRKPCLLYLLSHLHKNFGGRNKIHFVINLFNIILPHCLKIREHQHIKIKHVRSLVSLELTEHNR